MCRRWEEECIDKPPASRCGEYVDTMRCCPPWEVLHHLFVVPPQTKLLRAQILKSLRALLCTSELSARCTIRWRIEGFSRLHCKQTNNRKEMRNHVGFMGSVQLRLLDFRKAIVEQRLINVLTAAVRDG